MVKYCDQGLYKREVTVFHCTDRPKPANNIIISFFPVVNWLTSGFVSTTLSLNWLMCCLQTILKKSNG